MTTYANYMIKSFKHDGHLHRMWLENTLVPESALHPEHASLSMNVLINSQTKIHEADGSVWVSRNPGISFFIPGEWYNVVALIEDAGVRYYCNIASPAFLHRNVLTYIDYDLDVIVTPGGECTVVDEDEYENHKNLYRYTPLVQQKVKSGLHRLLERIERRDPPFAGEKVLSYYDWWQSRARRD
jgi:protein associated with RNAse G/E